MCTPAGSGRQDRCVWDARAVCPRGNAWMWSGVRLADDPKRGARSGSGTGAWPISGQLLAKPGTAMPVLILGLTVAAQIECCLLDAFHQCRQIAVEVEVIPREHPDGELSCGAAAPRAHVLLGHNDVVVSDECVDRT